MQSLEAMQFHALPATKLKGKAIEACATYLSH